MDHSGAVSLVCEQSNAAVTSWTLLQNMPAPRYGHTLVALNGKLYVMGGLGHETEVWYLNSATWTARAAMTSPGRCWHAGITLDNDRALVCGGGVSGASATCAIYTASTNTWAVAPSMAGARYKFNMVMSNSMFHWSANEMHFLADVIYIIGNDIGSSGKAEIEVYSVTTGGTTQSYALVTGGYWSGAAAVGKQNIY
jgi:hypothetical protein